MMVALPVPTKNQSTAKILNIWPTHVLAITQLWHSPCRERARVIVRRCPLEDNVLIKLKYFSCHPQAVSPWPKRKKLKSFCLALVVFSTKYSSTVSVLPARAPETVPLPWQLSTRTRLTAAPRATPESDPLTIPATCVPWLSHWLACSGTRI